MKIAFVYDRATKIGGAERILKALHALWPAAPLYTAFHFSAGAPWTAGWQVVPSFLQKIPFASRNHELFPWATPLAFETFSFDDFDVVISITSAEAKSILTKPKTLHICYCLTPTRYLWSHSQEYANNTGNYVKGAVIKSLYARALPYLRKWDAISSQRPDVYIAISEHVSKRIREYYHKKSFCTIYPPVDTKLFVPKRNETDNGHYLLVSRVVSYKRIDIVIQAFNALGLPLWIIGGGKGEKRMKEIARKNIHFLPNNLTDRELARYYQNCRAFVFAGNEDFGLVAAEAQACGKAVIAYRNSGIAEIVKHGKTGILYNRQTVESLMAAVRKFQQSRLSAVLCRKNAERFSLNEFKIKMKKTVDLLYQGYQNS